MGIQRIECASAVEPREWDELAARLGGGFFHCHAHVAYESTRPNAKPCFVKAFDERDECVGVAVGTITSPRYWPFSRFCRVATFAALPATREPTADSERAILAALEKELRRQGVFLIHIGSCDSPNSARVLSALSYNVRHRAEFYLDLDRPLGDVWKTLVRECRNKMRKAEKLGVITRVENSASSLSLLYAFQQESLRRHGVEAQIPGDGAQPATLSLLDSGRAELLVSYHAETPISAAMFGIFAGKAYYLLSGSSSAGQENAGPSHLIWTMIERMNRASANVLNLGGATVPTSKDDPAGGVYRFKRDFGTTIITQPAGTKTLSPTGTALNNVLRTSKSGRNMLSLAGRKAGSFFRYFYAVPWCVPPWGWREFWACFRCLISGNISEGIHPKLFSYAVGRHLNLQYALPLNRGRAAIELALRAMQLTEADEVIMPSYVCHAVLAAVQRAGARPVFADVGPDLHITAEAVEAVITPHTKCVIVPHLFGNAAPIDEIEKLLQGTGIQLIDDAAQSFGARCARRPVGTFGTCGIISCGPGKAFADPAGGLLVTNNRELYERAAAMLLGRESSTAVARRVLSFWIWRRFRRWTLPLAVLLNRLFRIEVDKEEAYMASTMSNLEAAIALEQFRAFLSNLGQRRRNAEVLLQALHRWSQYCISDLSESSAVVKLVLLLPPEGPDADWFVDSMARSGVECQKGYAPLHLGFGNAPRSLVNTEALWNRVVSIPIEIGVSPDFRLKTW